MSKRYFEEVIKTSLKHPLAHTVIPTRADDGVAGYDFYAKETVVIAPGEKHTFWTDIKAIMPADEVLYMHVRSSLGINEDLILANQTGVIDHSHANNPKNDGNIGVCIKNNSKGHRTINRHDRFAQGVFHPYLVVDGDVQKETVRSGGGIGSSGK